MENSDLLTKIITNPLSTRMRENAKNKDFFNTTHTEISGASLKSTTTPKTKNLESLQGLRDSGLLENEKNEVITTKNLDFSERKEKTTKNQHRKNKTLHIDKYDKNKPKEKEFYSTFHNDDEEMEVIKKSQKSADKQKKMQNGNDFYSVTSRNPEIIMKQAENALKLMNFSYKYVRNCCVFVKFRLFFKDE
jgi:hypothetical protein